ncbi:MAG: glycosyltransferase [Chloroflexota bacterium]
MRSRAMGFARILVSRGHAVKIIMPPWQTPEDQNKRWSEDGIDLEYVSLAGGIIPTVGRMVRMAKQFEPDVIWGFKPKAYSGMAMFWLWQTKLGRRPPLLITDTDDWEGWGGWNDIADYSTVQKYFFAWQERWGMSHCHLLTYASQALGNRAQGMGISPENSLYLPNGPGISTGQVPAEAIINLREKLGTHKRPTLLLYSRLFEFDTQRLINVLQKVHAEVPDLAVLSIGAGLFEDQATGFRAQLAQANLLDTFIDVGWLEEKDLPAHLQSADVGLYLMDDTLLNRTKCPVKLADMVAMGLPIAAEAVGEIPLYVADQQNGILQPSGDIKGVANALISMLKNHSDNKAFSKAAIERHTHMFAWEATVSKLEQKLEEIHESA